MLRMTAPVRGALLLLGTFPAVAHADGARDWLSVPVDMNFVYAYYTHATAETAIDSPLPVTGASVDATVPIFRYARSFDLDGRVGGIQVVAPYAFINAELDGTKLSKSVDGLGDIQTILIANLFGAPALTREQFVQWTPGDYLTASIAITAPTGAYDASRLVNAGNNRWAFKPQLSYGAPVTSAAWFTANANVEMFTDNDAYFGGRELAQDPLFTVDAHYSQNLSKALWLSADAVYSYGGETQIDGVGQDNGQSTLRLGVSGSFNFTPADAVSVAYGSTVWKRDHTANSHTIAININHAW